MNKSILGLFLIASAIAISHALPTENEHPSISDLEDSFGSLTHHGGGSAVAAADGLAHVEGGAEDEVNREKRLIRKFFGRRRYYGGYGGYGGYGRRRYRGYGGYGYYG